MTIVVGNVEIDGSCVGEAEVDGFVEIDGTLVTEGVDDGTRVVTPEVTLLDGLELIVGVTVTLGSKLVLGLGLDDG